jgi:hypothetical protein
MYTEIVHADIENCVRCVLNKWKEQGKPLILNIMRRGRKGVAVGYTADRSQSVSIDVDVIVEMVLYELKHAFFKVGVSHVLQQSIGVAMGSKSGPVLAWAVCMIHEDKFHSSLGSDTRYIHVYRYFDDVWQLLLVPQHVDLVAWKEKALKSLEEECYPSSLRLIVNSVGSTADMLSSQTTLQSGYLHCIHKCKNADELLAGKKLKVTSFVPFNSAHARRNKVMSNSVVGLLHRMYANTFEEDICHLLPNVLFYTLEMSQAGYPLTILHSYMRKFLKHPLVSSCQPGNDLYDTYSSVLKCVSILSFD